MIHLYNKSKEKRTTGRANAAQLRVQKDITSLELPDNIKIEFPEKNDLMNFDLSLFIEEGIYENGIFTFSVKVSDQYPHEAPKVKCRHHIYHPNIDYDGNVCLNILREDWKPVLGINHVAFGLRSLFFDLKPDDPLNKDAAEVLSNNPKLFQNNVRRAMQGGRVGEFSFDRVLK